MKNKLIKVKQFIIKNLLGMIIGGVVVGSISIATANYAFDSSNVYYNKSSSGGSYDNVQGALNELYSKANSGYKMYFYDGEIDSSNYDGYYKTAFHATNYKPIAMHTKDGNLKTTFHLPNNGFFKNKKNVGFVVIMKPVESMWKFKDLARYVHHLDCYNYNTNSGANNHSDFTIIYNNMTDSSNDAILDISCNINGSGNIDVVFGQFTGSTNGTAVINQSMQAIGE